MPIPALLSGLLPTAPVSGPAPLGPVPPAATPARVVPDAVVFSSAPLRLLSDLASGGLKQLATLLPTLEAAVGEGDPLPIGHLARATAAAARQVVEGHLALLAQGPDRIEAALRGEQQARAAAAGQAPELLRTLAREIDPAADPAADTRPSERMRAIADRLGAPGHPSGSLAEMEPDAPAHRWLDEAQRLFRRTDEALDRADLRLRPALADPRTAPAEASWALREIVAAQAQLAAATTRLGAAPVPARNAPRRHASRGSWLGGATGGVGALGFLLAMVGTWIANGVSILFAILAGLVATIYWAIRIGRAASGLRLDGRR